MVNDEQQRDEAPWGDMSVPDDFEETLRASVYPTLADMPKEMRRAQRISFMMGMLPRGVKMTREEVEEYVDNNPYG